jgi:glycosylphosphatidylinositol transamidase (GPIT) subunit GPI8
MHRRKRYKEVLLVADTCQASTLGDHITAPNVMVIGSSLRGESSYAHHSDTQLGLSVMERYTHAFLQFLTTSAKRSRDSTAVVATNGVLTPGLTIRQAMVDPYPFIQQRANIGFRTELLTRRDSDAVLLSDFFANNELLASNNAATATSPSETIQLVSSAHAVPVWPRISAQSRKHPRRSVAVPRRFLALRNPAVYLLLPAYNPSDEPFLGLLAVFLALVLVLSYRRT